MTDVETITLILAVVGTVLGVLNTVHQYRQTKVKLRVIPKALLIEGRTSLSTSRREVPDRCNNLCVEVINLSSFPVTIAEVGFRYRWTGNRGLMFQPRTSEEGKSLPIELQSRRSVTVFANSDELPDAFDGPHRVRCVYAMTSCDTTVFGSSPAFKTMRKRLSQKANEANRRPRP